MKKYAEMLNEAVACSKKNSTLPNLFKFRQAEIPDEELDYIISFFLDDLETQIHSGLVSLDFIRKSCVGVHINMDAMLKGMGYPSLLTFGDVIYQGNALFNVSDENLLAEINERNPFSEENFEFHAWITIGHKIIDVTLTPWIKKEVWVSGKMLGGGYCISGDAQKIQDEFELAHIPMICGRDFTKKITIPDLNKVLNRYENLGRECMRQIKAGVSETLNPLI